MPMKGEVLHRQAGPLCVQAELCNLSGLRHIFVSRKTIDADPFDSKGILDDPRPSRVSERTGV